MKSSKGNQEKGALRINSVNLNAKKKRHERTLSKRKATLHHGLYLVRSAIGRSLTYLLGRNNRITRILRAILHPRRCWHTFIQHNTEHNNTNNKKSPKERFIYQCSFATLCFVLLTSLTFSNGYGIDAGGALGSASAYYAELNQEIDVQTLAVIDEDGFFQNTGANPLSDASTVPDNTQFSRHIVNLGAGDTLSTIAKKYALEPKTIRLANNMNEGDPIYDGMALRIPKLGDGIFHVVKPGEDSAKIASQYGVNEQDVIASSNGLTIGQEIFVKGTDGLYLEDGLIEDEPEDKIAINNNPPVQIQEGVTITTPEVPAPKPTTDVAITAPAPAPAAVSTAPIVAQSPTGGWVNPVAGSYRLTQGYRNYHRAWDMASRQLPQIVAARSGTVVTSGWNSGGYGNYVVIDHGDGFTSLYAHMLTTPYVSLGDKVVQGQTIGQMGSTGRSTGPHLHLEIIKDGVKQNPANHIPG